MADPERQALVADWCMDNRSIDPNVVLKLLNNKKIIVEVAATRNVPAHPTTKPLSDLYKNTNFESLQTGQLSKVSAHWKLLDPSEKSALLVVAETASNTLVAESSKKTSTVCPADLDASILHLQVYQDAQTHLTDLRRPKDR